MIADSMVSLVKNSSVIRAMFEEGNRLAKLYGAENVYDFIEAIKDIIKGHK
jgi:aspartate aminotransferase